MTKLSTVLDQVDSGTMLPEFQRGYVWNRDQGRGLMRSVHREYPVGALLVWETEAARSAFSGEPPEVVGAPTRDEERVDLADAARRWHDDGIDREDIAVVGRGQHVRRGAASALRKADVPVVELRKANGESAVRLGSMHGLEGPEFRAVAVVGVSHGVLPRKGITAPEEDEVVHRHEMQDERNLLFVAATRPRERLRVSWHGEPSPFLPGRAP